VDRDLTGDRRHFLASAPSGCSGTLIYDAARDMRLSYAVGQNDDVPSRLRHVFAQLGPKPGSRRSLALLPVASELTGDGWVMIDKRTWRTGWVGNPSDWSRRAKEAGTITAWRSFKQTDTARWLWVEVIPVASAEDSASALQHLLAMGLRNLGFQGTVTDEHDQAGVAVPGCAASWAHEQRTTGPQGEGVARYVAGTVGAFVLVSAGSGLADTWPWEELVRVVEISARRILETEAQG